MGDGDPSDADVIAEMVAYLDEQDGGDVGTR